MRERNSQTRPGQKHRKYRGEAATTQSARPLVWFLTENSHKFREACAILAPSGIPIRQLSRKKVELQDSNPEKIARFALETAIEQYKRLILVEDSGLFIDELNGFPGPFASFTLETIGLAGILELLRRSRRRSAYYQSSIVLGSPSISPRVFTGRVKGRISNRILGSGGFGYDPIFVPNGSKMTFGQSSDDFKNRTSHRARAFARMARWYNLRYGRRKGPI